MLQSFSSTEVEEYIKNHPCKILSHNPYRSQIQNKAKQWLTDSCQHNSWYGISAHHQLHLDQWDVTANRWRVSPDSFNKTYDFILRTTDPSVPQFPTPAWPNPLSRSVWTCRAELPVPRMLSRHHTMLALSLLTRLDYSLTTWTSKPSTVGKFGNSSL